MSNKKLSFRNYSKIGLKGAWHIEHSIAKANGGTDHLNNLFPACISCNLEKGINSTRSERKKYGNTRAPLSKTSKKTIRKEKTTSGIIIGGLIGSLGGVFGMAIGATIGGIIGNENSPKR